MKKLILTSLVTLSTLAAVVSASSTTTNTTTLKPVVKSLSAGYFNYLNGPTLAANQKDYSINHYFSLKHKFNKDYYITGVFQPNQSLGNLNQNELTQGDHYVKVGLPSIYKGDNGLTVGPQFRFYLPTSDASKKAQLSGKVQMRVYVTKSIGKFDLTYLLIPAVYLNRANKDGQSMASHGHWLQASYNISEKFTIDFAVYPGWKYKKNKDVSFNTVPMYPGFSYSFTDKLSMSTYVEASLVGLDAKKAMLGSSFSYSFF